MVYGSLYGMASRDIALCFFLAAFLYSSFGKNQMRYSPLLLLEKLRVLPLLTQSHKREQV